MISMYARLRKRTKFSETTRKMNKMQGGKNLTDHDMAHVTGTRVGKGWEKVIYLTILGKKENISP
jgi:hypothetical protein